MSIFLESFIPALLTSILIVLTLLITMFVKNSKKQVERERVMLEDMRRFYESQIYNINNKMVSNPERWKDANHLVTNSSISSSNDYFQQKEVQYSSFLKSVGLKSSDIEVIKDSVFVLTPFHDDMEETYNMVREICYRVGLRSNKSDDFVHTDEIFQQIIKLMVKSRLVIANIDGRNPNVFYELGIAHALGKPTIMIAKSLNEIPFDLQSKTIIIYRDYDELKEKLSIALTKLIINN